MGRHGLTSDSARNLLEESVHLLDWAIGLDGRPFSEGKAPGRLKEPSAAFKQIYEDSPDILGDYAARNAREYLAQGIRSHYHDPEELKRAAPKVYNWLKEYWLSDEFWRESL